MFRQCRHLGRLGRSLSTVIPLNMSKALSRSSVKSLLQTKYVPASVDELANITEVLVKIESPKLAFDCLRSFWPKQLPSSQHLTLALEVCRAYNFRSFSQNLVVNTLATAPFIVTNNHLTTAFKVWKHSDYVVDGLRIYLKRAGLEQEGLISDQSTDADFCAHIVAAPVDVLLCRSMLSLCASLSPEDAQANPFILRNAIRALLDIQTTTAAYAPLDFYLLVLVLAGKTGDREAVASLVETMSTVIAPSQLTSAEFPMKGRVPHVSVLNATLEAYNLLGMHEKAVSLYLSSVHVATDAAAITTCLFSAERERLGEPVEENVSEEDAVLRKGLNKHTVKKTVVDVDSIALALEACVALRDPWQGLELFSIHSQLISKHLSKRLLSPLLDIFSLPHLPVHCESSAVNAAAQSELMDLMERIGDKSCRVSPEDRSEAVLTQLQGKLVSPIIRHAFMDNLSFSDVSSHLWDKYVPLLGSAGYVEMAVHRGRGLSNTSLTSLVMVMTRRNQLADLVSLSERLKSHVAWDGVETAPVIDAAESAAPALQRQQQHKHLFEIISNSSCKFLDMCTVAVALRLKKADRAVSLINKIVTEDPHSPLSHRKTFSNEEDVEFTLKSLVEGMRDAGLTQEAAGLIRLLRGEVISLESSPMSRAWASASRRVASSVDSI